MSLLELLLNTKIIPSNLSMQAYEEKEKLWEKELRKIKGLYDNRLRASQQKSSKMEQALTNQTYQVSENLVIRYSNPVHVFCKM